MLKYSLAGNIKKMEEESEDVDRMNINLRDKKLLISLHTYGNRIICEYSKGILTIKRSK